MASEVPQPMFASSATCHTTLQTTLMQLLLFRRVAMFDIEFQADWLLIKQLKQETDKSK